jgi:4'-phosphopantetheinyl transferase
VRPSSWQTPSQIPSLDIGVIHLWQANTELLAEHVDAFTALVDAAERTRGDAFHAAVDRRRHLVTRGVLRTLAGHYTSTPPDAVGFELGTFGKPRIAASHGGPLSFNISHSGVVVLLAFAREGAIGVDVEQWNMRLGDVERARIGESVFSPRERAALGALTSPQERERAFYALWSRKEAYLKGTGAGISDGLAHVEVSADEEARLIDDRRDPQARSEWALLDIEVGPRYSAALAFSPPGSTVTQLLPPPHLFDRVGT